MSFLTLQFSHLVSLGNWVIPVQWLQADANLTSLTPYVIQLSHWRTKRLTQAACWSLLMLQNSRPTFAHWSCVRGVICGGVTAPHFRRPRRKSGGIARICLVYSFLFDALSKVVHLHHVRCMSFLLLHRSFFLPAEVQFLQCGHVSGVVFILLFSRAFDALFLTEAFSSPIVWVLSTRSIVNRHHNHNKL